MLSTESETRPSVAAQSETSPSVAADPSSMVATFWAQWLEQSTRGTQALLEAIQTASDPHQLQRRWLDAVSRTIDDFMRTPVFLELLRDNLKVVTDLKGLQDQVLKDTARQIGLPTAADITGLYERLHSTEQKILGLLQAIDERLKAIETKQ